MLKEPSKKLLKGSTDPYLSLLTYRTTPLPWCGLSPAELLMGRRLRSNIPQTLTPQWPHLEDFRVANAELKQKQKQNYNSRHGTRPLADIPQVWVTTSGTQAPGQVTAHADTLRSYLVTTPTGVIRRNRAHLTVNPDTQSVDTPDDHDRSPIMTRSRTGTRVTPPNRR